MDKVQKFYGTDKVKALTERTIAQCKQQGFTVGEMTELLTQIQIAIIRRENELKNELF